MPRQVDSHCRAFQTAIDVLGRPWTALILTVLQPGPLRFNELAEQARGPTDKLLSARLKDLEARGLVERRVDVGPPIKVTYELTPCGRGFQRVASAIEEWGQTIPERPRGTSKRRAERGRQRSPA